MASGRIARNMASGTEVGRVIERLGAAVGSRDNGALASTLSELPLLVATSKLTVSTSVWCACVCVCAMCVCCRLECFPFENH